VDAIDVFHRKRFAVTAGSTALGAGVR